MAYHRRQGCIAGLLQLFLLDRLFDWLQTRYGFGRGPSCAGLGRGCLLLIILALLACSIVSNTDWFRVGF